MCTNNSKERVYVPLLKAPHSCQKYAKESQKFFLKKTLKQNAFLMFYIWPISRIVDYQLARVEKSFKQKGVLAQLVERALSNSEGTRIS